MSPALPCADRLIGKSKMHSAQLCPYALLLDEQLSVN
jgi:hypothetical protein